MGCRFSVSSRRMGVGRAARRCRPLECTLGWPPPPPPPAWCTLGVRLSLRGVHCMACGEPPPSIADVCIVDVCRLQAEAAGRGGPSLTAAGWAVAGWAVAPLPSKCMPLRSQAISCSQCDV